METDLINAKLFKPRPERPIGPGGQLEITHVHCIPDLSVHRATLDKYKPHLLI